MDGGNVNVSGVKKEGEEEENVNWVGSCAGHLVSQVHIPFFSFNPSPSTHRIRRRGTSTPPALLKTTPHFETDNQREKWTYTPSP
jgi:hypothetical protein